MNERMKKLKKFIEQSPNDCFLKHALALEYIKIGDDAEAMKLFKSNLDQDETYIATYYHLGKLLERIGDNGDAVMIYERGMEMSKKAGDIHSYNEIQGAYEDLVY